MDKDVEKRGPGRLAPRRSWALVPAGAAVVATTVALMVAHGSARAQGPVYPIPTPTPTGTPFQQPPPPPPHGPGLMHPFPVVHTSGTYARRTTTFKKVTVRAPKGAHIDARCNHRRCRRTRRTLHRRRTVHIKRMQKTYPPRTTLTIRISGRHAIGKYVWLRTRRGKPPRRRDSCVAPGQRAPEACPTP
jgi:hypothetical protein